MDMKNALNAAGFSFSSFDILDGRNRDDTAALVKNAGLIVLAGGHVPTQNAFFQQCGLKAAIRGFDGVLIGISAGTMNCADPVYAQPEEEGEAISPHYRRWLRGLGVTRTMLLPHYQMVKDSFVDGLRLFDEITLPDSIGRTFYAIPDGSWLLGQNGRETLFGEAHRIRDGRMEQAGWENEALALS
jgi:dipeptidase E